jgi:AcrR family transcriptional regulator
LQLFAERGYDGVSMRDLAGALNIQAPSIYSHFASKADLVRSLVLPALNDVNVLMDRAPDGYDSVERRQWLEEYGRWLVRNREACHVALLDPGVRSDPVIGPLSQRSRERVVDLMVQFGAKDDAAARAAKGALVYPAVLCGISEAEIPQLVDAAIRALGVVD